MGMPTSQGCGSDRAGNVHLAVTPSPRNAGGMSITKSRGSKVVPTRWPTYSYDTPTVTGSFMPGNRRHDWLPQGGFERLEPYDGKLSRTVLRGARGLVTVLWAGNGPRLPGVAQRHL